MKLIGFLWVFGCLFVGQVLIFLTKLPLPPSIIGLLVLFFLLQSGMVKLSAVQSLAKTLLDYLAFLVVPACISIMQYLDILKGQWIPIVIASCVSSALVIVTTGDTHSLVRRLQKRYKER